MALTVLRVIRGWTQEELAKASGIRGSSISDYERGKMVPGLKTLQRLTTAMGYSVPALDRVQSFIFSLQTESWLNEAADSSWASGGGSSPGRQSEERKGDLPAAGSLLHSAALRREVDRVSAEAGKVVSQLTRLIFVVMSSPTPVGDQPPGD